MWENNKTLGAVGAFIGKYYVLIVQLWNKEPVATTSSAVRMGPGWQKRGGLVLGVNDHPQLVIEIKLLWIVARPPISPESSE